MASPAVENFLANLEKSNLLAADVLQRVRAEAEPNGADSTVVVLAPKLVQQGLLTPWQVDQLVAGRTSFFLGKYKLLGELGHGGMGAVYKAVQARLGRVVAIKVMAPKLIGDEQAVARFHREMEAVAALDHPHVVAAFDADQTEGTHFLVMEYVEGESLAAILKRDSRLPMATACECIRQAALGLAHAHERGMAHRDIKPANLLLARTADGQPLVKILDMGLARFTVERGEETELTSTGQVMGTPDYIAPEQARSTKRADIRSDIYSLGCTLFRTLTGQLPFDGESVMEKLMARAMGDAPPLRQYLPETPAALEAVLAKMLARDPAARYQNPAEVAAALAPFSSPVFQNLTAGRLSRGGSAPPAASRDPGVDQFLQQLAREANLDDSGETTTDSAGTHIALSAEGLRTRGRLLASVEERSRADRRRITQAVAGTLLLAVGIAAGWWWWLAGQTHLEFDWPVEERAGAQAEVDGYQLALPERAEIRVPPGRAGRHRVHIVRPGYETIDTTLEFARGQRQTYRPKWNPTAETVRRLGLADLESKIEALLRQLAGRRPSPDDAALESLWQRFIELRPTFRMTGDQPAFEKLWRRLPFPADYLKMETPSGEPLALDPQAMSAAPRELVAAWGDARLKAPLYLQSLSVSPDGRLAATRSSDQTLYVWDLQSGRLHVPPIAQSECWGVPQFSPDGKFLHYVTDGIMIWSLDDRRVVKSLPLSSSRAADAFAWIPGRSVVAWTYELQAVQLWDFENGKSQESLAFPLDDAKESICALAASRDGRFLAAGTSQGKIRIWDVATRESFDLPKFDGHTYSLAFSPDGGQLAAGIDTSLCLWDLATRDLRYAKRSSLNTGIASLSWHPDGKILSFNTGTGDVALWNVAEGAFKSYLHTQVHHNTVAAFSQEGRRLVTAGGDGVIQVWDADSLEELLPTGPLLTAAAVDPLGEWVAVGTGDSRIEIHDLQSGDIREEISLPFVPSQLYISPDRKLMGAIAGPPVFRVHVIALDGQHPVRELREMESAQSIAFTPDATLLVASAWGGGVAGWSTADFSLKFKALPVDPRWPAAGAELAVSRDSRTMIMVGGSTLEGAVAAIHLPEGKKLYFAPAIVLIGHVVLAGDPEQAITSAGPYIQIVDLAQGKAREIVTIPGVHGDLVNFLNVSPDGERIVAALSSNKLWILSAESLNALAELELGNRLMAPQQALYTPDGRHVITVNANGTLFVWRVEEWTSDFAP